MGNRERYAAEGAAGMGDAELLGLILGIGAAGLRADELGGALLRSFGSLSAIWQASPAALATTPGLGPAQAVRVHAALEAGRRMALQPRERPLRLPLPADAAAWLCPRLAPLEVEELHALYFDRQQQLLHHKAITRGNAWMTVMDPHQVLREAIRMGAPRLLIAHNHPSGDPRPSPADVDVTRRLARCADVLGLQLIDHIIVAGDRWTSLAAEGVISSAPAPAGLLHARGA